MNKDYRGKKGGDNYKPLRFYEERISGVRNGFDHFSEGDAHYFTYNIEGKVILISEGYTSTSGRDNGIKSVDKNRTIETRYKRDSLESGQQFFNLIAGNHQEIATSAWFDSTTDLEAAISVLMGEQEASAQPPSSAAPNESPQPKMVAPPATPKPQALHSNYAGSEKTSKPSWPWWIGALILILVVWYLFSNTCGCQRPADSVVVSDSTMAEKPVMEESVSTMPAPAEDLGVKDLGSFQAATLPDGLELNIPEFGVENQLIQFIEDDSRPVDKTTWFNFDRIGFAVGSAELTAESEEQIENIANILKAYPELALKIGGYTDNTGSLELNMNLSQQRAGSVMNALLSKDLSEERLKAEGYGPEHPVASNDTEEGRAQNRRIALRVTNK